MKIITYFIIFIVVISSLFACNDDDKFSTNSSLRLTFSSDTIQFDTVFTTLGTATRQLKVYNKNSDALIINSIELMNPQKTGFRMNVDGESGNTVNNVKILGKDSMYIFVEATINPLNQNNPLLISDSICFKFNGVTQYVRLEAIGQDVIIWKNKTIEKDTTLTGEKPFLIYNTLDVKSGATLNIEKNAHFYFHQDAKLSVSGTIVAKGTINEPVYFRGDRTDDILTNTPYNRVPGQWYGIQVASESYNNHFENVRIQNGVYGVQFEASQVTETKAFFYNTVIQNTTQEVISATNAKIEAKNCLFANAGTYTLYLTGGDYNFLQCTIANYLSYPGIFRKGNIYITENSEYPLKEFRFINSILSASGNSKSEISLNFMSDNVNYTFINCLLRIPEIDNQHYVNTVWNQNPGFKTIYNVYTTDNNLRYYYNFELTENSKAINNGSREYAAELPYDIRGVSRLENGPDIGCFEWKSN